MDLFAHPQIIPTNATNGISTGTFTKGHERIRTSNYAFIDILDDGKKAPKLENAFKEPYETLWQDQHTVVTQQTQLLKKLTAKMVAIALWTAGLSLILPESTSAVNIKDMNVKRTPRLFIDVLNHYFKDDSKLEFLLQWVPIMRQNKNFAIEWSIKQFPFYFARICRAAQT